jgi:hypothetical protein
VLRLKLVNIYTMNLKLRKVRDEEIVLLLCCLILCWKLQLDLQQKPRGSIFDKCSQIMAYADGVVRIRRRLQTLKY